MKSLVVAVQTNIRKPGRSQFWADPEGLIDLHVYMKAIKTLNLKHIKCFFLSFTAVDDEVDINSNRNLRTSVRYYRVLK